MSDISILYEKGPISVYTRRAMADNLRPVASVALELLAIETLPGILFRLPGVGDGAPDDLMFLSRKDLAAIAVTQDILDGNEPNVWMKPTSVANPPKQRWRAIWERLIVARWRDLYSNSEGWRNGAFFGALVMYLIGYYL